MHSRLPPPPPVVTPAPLTPGRQPGPRPQRRRMALALLWGVWAALLTGCAASKDISGADVPAPTTLPPLWQTQLPTEEGPVALAVADFDDDGHRDVAVVNGTKGSVSLYRGDGSSLAIGNRYEVGRGASAIVVMSLNGDKLPDLVIANAADNTLSTLINQGMPGGVFAAGPLVTGIENPSLLVSGDLTGDGIADLVVGSSGTDLITVLENKPAAGTLSPLGTPLAAGPFVRGLALLPLDDNQPKRLDLAVAQAGSGEIGLFRNDGQGRLSQVGSPLRVSADSVPVAVVAGQLDIDPAGRIDMAILEHGRGQLSLGKATGNGLFRLSALPLGPKPAALTTGTIYDAARLDIAAALPGQDVVAIWRNSDASAWGNAGALTYVETLGLPTDLTIADLDGDGHGELLVVCRESNQLRILQLSKAAP